MAQKNNDMSSMTLGELTMEQILDYVSENVPAFAAGVCIADDGGECRTLTYTGGNRAACVGLADLAKRMAKRKLMKMCTAVSRDEHEDEDNG
jgi:hypothetical protein